MTLSLPKTIAAAAQVLPEGGVLMPREFLYLGERAAVDQAFSRLVKQGKLVRIGRGLYAVPVASRFGTRAPAPEKVMQALERQTGEVLVPGGATEANRLGLTTQMPVREVYLSNGPKRQLRFGKSLVQVQHVNPKGLFLAKSLAGAAARAMKWLGPQRIEDVVRKLHKTLPGEEWRTLAQARGTYPSWMAKAIGREMAHG